MREAILQALRQEGHISGEELGRRLHITRTAVWKHIRELRRLGYRIDSSPRSGYSFLESADLLLPEEVAPGLATHTFGKRITHFHQVTSTQDAAEALARNGAVEGTVVIAEEQTSGRGRKGRSWASPSAGGLYISIILRPTLPPARIIQIPLVTGVAVCRAISRLTPLQPRIKWPNDVFVGGKKVAGILAEMNCEPDRVNYIILGIGANVNTPGALLAETTGGIGTSLAAEGRETFSRAAFVRQLLVEFEALYDKFLAHGFAPIRAEWKRLSFTIGAKVKVSDAGEEIAGEAIDIDEDGFLLVRQDSGEVRRVVSGDVAASNCSPSPKKSRPG